jgi:hypothetical protein
MKKIALLAIGLTGLALTACAPRYYDDRYGDRYVSDRYVAPRGHIEYTDRDRYNDPYYATRDADQVRGHYRDYRDHY